MMEPTHWITAYFLVGFLWLAFFLDWSEIRASMKYGSITITFSEMMQIFIILFIWPIAVPIGFAVASARKRNREEERKKVEESWKN